MRKAILLCLVALMLAIGVGSAGALRYPPPVKHTVTPPLVVIPGTYIYVVPNGKSGLFYYDGFWYRQHKDKWFRSPRYYGRHWTGMRDADMPKEMLSVPPDYRDRIQGREHLRYRDVRHNWSKWKDAHKWESDPGWREKGGIANSPGGPDVNGDKGEDKK